MAGPDAGVSRARPNRIRAWTLPVRDGTISSRMAFPSNPFAAPGLWLTLLFCALLPGPLRAYDAPDLERPLVEVDALTLEAEPRTTLVEALCAIASNFPDSALIDDDLREKALALALQLDPFSANARNTHRALLAGRTPDPTRFFDESVSEVSEVLWRTASGMIGEEPEDRRLALYLMEVSLLVHPSPPPGRVAEYGELSDFSGQSWNGTVELQPAVNPSNRKLRNLFVALERRGGAGDRDMAPADRPRDAAAPDPKVPPVSPPPPTPAESGVELRREEAELLFVALVLGPARVRQDFGRAYLLVSPAGEADAEAFTAPETSGPAAARARQMKWIPAEDGVQVDGLDRGEQLLRLKRSALPEMRFATFGFDPEVAFPAASRLLRTDLSLASAMLVESAITGQTFVEDVVFAGIVPRFQGDGTFLPTAGKDILRAIAAAEDSGLPFLAIPDSHVDEMIEFVITTRRLEPLFEAQIIGYSSWDELLQIAFGADREARLRAGQAFREIAAVREKMTLVDLAKNAKVQERLEGILSVYPRHLSAKVMLAFGRAPDDEKALIREAVRGVDQAIAPFIRVVAELSRGTPVGEGDFAPVLAPLEEADVALTQLRPTIPEGAGDYLDAAQDFLVAAENFVRMANKETSMAEQRLREMREEFEALQEVRGSLGIDLIEFDRVLRPEGPRRR